MKCEILVEKVAVIEAVKTDKVSERSVAAKIGETVAASGPEAKKPRGIWRRAPEMTGARRGTRAPRYKTLLLTPLIGLLLQAQSATGKSRYSIFSITKLSTEI